MRQTTTPNAAPGSTNYSAFIGTRPVNDREWDVGLHIVFLDRAAHDAYQDDPTHLKFIAEQKPNWAKVRVFDSLV